MLKQTLTLVAMSVLMATNAYATQAPVEEEREFPLAIVFALIAVFCGVGTALFAASQSKKKKD